MTLTLMNVFVSPRSRSHLSLAKGTLPLPFILRSTCTPPFSLSFLEPWYLPRYPHPQSAALRTPGMSTPAVVSPPERMQCARVPPFLVFFSSGPAPSFPSAGCDVEVARVRPSPFTATFLSRHPDGLLLRGPGFPPPQTKHSFRLTEFFSSSSSLIPFPF